jgi:hypothetical protein
MIKRFGNLRRERGKKYGYFGEYKNTSQNIIDFYFFNQSYIKII